MEHLKIKLAFADFETDPFARDFNNPSPETHPELNRLVVKPFCVGVMHEDGSYWHDWGDNCADNFLAYIKTIQDPTIFYFHNGGRFDFYFVQHGMESQEIPCMIKKVLVAGKFGIHELRDSTAIFASSLRSAVGKLDFDYSKMERENREANKAEILHYLRDDCAKLKTLMLAFFAEMGPKRAPRKGSFADLDPFRAIRFTASSYAFKALIAEPLSNGSKIDQPRAFGKKGDGAQEKLNQKLGRRDNWHRPFYYGGRVQVFEHGKIEIDPARPLKKYDVNSMYPAAMANFSHPVTANCMIIGPGSKMMRFDADNWVIGYSGCPYFVEFEGETLGVLGQRENGSHSLKYRRGEFRMVCHEFRAGVELGYVKVTKIKRLFLWSHADHATFEPFVTKYYTRRREQKAELGKVLKQIARLMKYARAKGNGFFAQAIDAQGNASEKLDESALRACGESWVPRFLGILATREEMAAQKKAEEETTKLILNGAYGKTAFDYSKYPKQYWHNPKLCPDIDPPSWAYSGLDDIIESEDPGLNEMGLRVGDSSTLEERYNGVHMAASITSAARSILMRALHSAKRPIYCDTDSILCEEMGADQEIDGAKLGAWKLEKDNIVEAYIAGPKLYALRSVKIDKKTGAEISTREVRAKGARQFGFDQMVFIAQNPREMVRNFAISGVLRVNGESPKRFIDRNIRAITSSIIPAGNIAAYKARGVAPELAPPLTVIEGLAEFEPQTISPELRAQLRAIRQKGVDAE